MGTMRQVPHALVLRLTITCNERRVGIGESGERGEWGEGRVGRGESGESGEWGEGRGVSGEWGEGRGVSGEWGEGRVGRGEEGREFKAELELL